MPNKTKRQAVQERRLSIAEKQARKNKNEVRKSGRRSPVNTGKRSLFSRLFGKFGRPPQTAQQSIPYRAMYRDGICRVSERVYSKCIQYQDINYQLAQNEDKTHIFENYCDFINYFDSSIRVQFSFINWFGNTAELLSAIDIPDRGDDNDSSRQELSGILKSQRAKGNNGLEKTKYATFSVEADDLKSAKLRLERMETDILNNYKLMGVSAKPLTGQERLAVLHGQFHPEDGEKMSFNWDDMARSGLSTKDFIAPTSFDFRERKSFRMGDTIGAVSYLQILAPELSDRMLAEFLDMESALAVNIHIQSIDQAEAIKTIKRKLTDLDSMKIQEQKKAVRAGYDIDIIPTDLATYGDEAKNLLTDLQSRNERMFLVTIIVLNTAKTRQKLEGDIFQASSVAQKYNCALKRLDWQQEQGLMSSLPLGNKQIEIQRGLTTSSTAIFVPFTTQVRPEECYILALVG